ncbi:hypothetical protein HIM_09810 [Hirsutella minnesotensis 3608]|uniref:BRCT domain-containing protein n=1 Tax=Hirsutella minnesotensis 3608 TaxID=1043627 RepID=A0A0F7ZXI8_9HYPO|nr:hypothetical protein HIM_09810 [Hirsutella minnesotensis 3608]
MTSLKSQKDQVAHFAGTFILPDGTKKSHKDLAEALGVESTKSIKQCTVVIATTDSYNTNKSIRGSKDQHVPFLNEAWVCACIDAGKWIEPLRHHFHDHPESSALPEENTTMSTRLSTPDTAMTDVWTDAAGSSTRDTTPGNQGAKEDRVAHRQGTSMDDTATPAQEQLPAQTQEQNSPAPSQISAHTPSQPAQNPRQTASLAPARDSEQNPATHGKNSEHPPSQAEKAPSQSIPSAPEQTHRQSPVQMEPNPAQPGQTQTESGDAHAQTERTEQRFDRSSSSMPSFREQWYSDAGIVHKIVLPIHPADKHKAREDQRRNVELNIDFAFRYFLWISDPETQFPEHKIQGKTKRDLRASWIVPMKDSGIQGQQYRDVGQTLGTSTERTINDCKMEDFDWWGTATDGRVCYNAGVLPGESKPRVWARTTLKKKWKDIDTEISRIRMIFAQPSLAEERELSQSGKEKSVILENLREYERYLEAEKNL